MLWRNVRSSTLQNRTLVYTQTSSLGPPQRTSSTSRWSVWPVDYPLTAKSGHLTVSPLAFTKPVEAGFEKPFSPKLHSSIWLCHNAPNHNAQLSRQQQRAVQCASAWTGANSLPERRQAGISGVVGRWSALTLPPCQACTCPSLALHHTWSSRERDTWGPVKLASDE